MINLTNWLINFLNGYPKRLVHKLAFSTDFRDSHLDGDGDAELVYKKLPYINNFSDNFIKIFNKLHNLKIAKYNQIKIHNIFPNIKDKTPLPLKINFVYNMSRLVCDGCYIDQTCQLKNDGHIGKRACAMGNHSKERNHKFDFGNTSILNIDNNYKNRLPLQMAQINKHNNCVNFEFDTD